MKDSDVELFAERMDFTDEQAGNYFAIIGLIGLATVFIFLLASVTRVFNVDISNTLFRAFIMHLILVTMGAGFYRYVMRDQY